MPLPKMYLLIGAFLFSVATLWMPYTVRMWSQGHYQFFPLLLAAAAGMLWARRHDISACSTKPTPWLLVTSIAGVAVLTLFGHLNYSGLTGAVATILGICVLIYGAFGAGGLRVALSVLWLLILVVPLPLGFDQELILKMQFLASSLASNLLDGLGVLHFREGVILITEKSQFMTEEACSGIRSLFSSLAVVAVYSVSLHHAAGRVILNLMQTVCWVLIGNAIRLVAVVLLADNVDRWYATGTGHELLGIVAFVFILAMVVSTDALLAVLVYGQITERSDDSLLRVFTDADTVIGSEIPVQKLVRWILLGLFVVVGLVGLRVAYVKRNALNSFDLASLPAIPNPTEQDLPSNLNGWQRVSFEHVERDISTATLAKDSFVWKYTKENAAIIVSVDCPWAEWHNLKFCYFALGWDIDAKYFVPNTQSIQSSRNRETQNELTMTKADRHGFVIFAVVDRNGRELVPPTRHRGIQSPSFLARSFLQQSAASLGFGVQAQFEVIGLELPATTIQVLSESPEPLSEQRLRELRLLYDQIRFELLKSNRWTSSQTVRK